MRLLLRSLTLGLQLRHALVVLALDTSQLLVLGVQRGLTLLQLVVFLLDLALKLLLDLRQRISMPSRRMSERTMGE